MNLLSNYSITIIFSLLLLLGITCACEPSVAATEKKVNNSTVISDTIAIPQEYSEVTEETALTLPADYFFPYELSDPDETVKADNKLDEISGLSLTDDEDHLFAVQDENGTVYRIRKKDGETKDSYKFGKKGDYEGIEKVGKKVYVVNSSGDIYQISKLGKEKQSVKKYNTFLRKENDVEGLGYDPKKNKLLLACKGRPATGESLEDFRLKKCIYGFDLETKKLDSLPEYVIDIKDIQAFLKANMMVRHFDKLMSFFSPTAKNLSFNPSAVAINPITDNLYIISSVGKLMIVMNREGQILHIEKMDKDVHKQPEGIAFENDGTLFISNEAADGKKPRLHRFEWQSNQ